MNKDKFHALTRAEKMSDNIINLLCHELRTSINKPLNGDLADQAITVLYELGNYKTTMSRASWKAEQ